MKKSTLHRALDEGLVALLVTYAITFWLISWFIGEVSTLKQLTASTQSGVVIIGPYGDTLIQYTTPSGKNVIFSPSNDRLYTPGDHVSVRYDPHNPTHARVEDFSGLWFGVIFLFSLVIGFLILAIKGTFGYLLERQKKNQQGIDDALK